MRNLLPMMAAAVLIGWTGLAEAQTPFKIGLVLPMTGPSGSTGKQIDAAVKLYMQQHGDTVAGRKVEVIVRDDAGVADTTKRLVQELVVRDHVDVLAGFGLTPLALAAAPIATQAKIPMVVMAAATSMIIEQSPFIVRTSQTLPQAASVMGTWAAQNGMKKVVTVVTDYGPGADAETWFNKSFTTGGGQILANLRAPLTSPDFAPVLQRARDAGPDGVFVFTPSGMGAIFIRQFVERGMDKSGIKLIATGDVTDDDLLNGMGDVVQGVVTSGPYSASHDSALNKKFVADFKAANDKMRPNFMAVFGYDGMALIYHAVEATKGAGGGQALLDAMKGYSFESPRGPITIDAASRDIVENMYIRKVEKVNGELYNMEFATIPDVHDPAMGGKVK